MLPAVPDWVADAVFYQVFPDRFARSDRVAAGSRLEAWEAPPTRHGYKGGDLLGIVQRLDHLESLGVNALYLTPIFHSASNHRYHTYDYFRVDPMLGDNAGLDRLLDAAHARGMRVVLDAVLNHVGRGFFPFHDVLENGSASPFFDWFEVRREPLAPYGPGAPGYACWHGIPALPKLNTSNPEVSMFLRSVVRHWARRGIDGWRFDTPEEIRTPGFWESIRAEAKAVDPDLYLVGEIWKDASEWLGTRFDGTMSYWLGGHTLVYAAGDRFRFDVTHHEYPLVREPIDALAYGDHVQEVMSRYSPDQLRANLNLYGSHDTARALTMCDGDRDAIVLAGLLLFTVPGAPCIYYGDEIGMKGGNDPDCRAGFPWDEEARWDEKLLSTFRELGALRRAHIATRRGTWRRLARDAHIHAFAMEHPEETLWVATNATDATATLELDEPPPSSATRLFGEGTLSRGTVSLPPRRGVVWRVR